MQASKILRRSLAHYSFKKQRLFEPFPVTGLISTPQSDPQTCRYQTHRTLILDRSPSQLVQLNRLSDSDSGIVELTLNRPERRNAIGRDFLRGFIESLEAVSKDSSANVVLIRSLVPKVFCAGADLKERREQTPAENESFVNSLRASFTFLEKLCIPSIAVVEGAALGGGLEMALACDLRICGEDAVLGLPETGLAIIPGAGATQRLPRLIGKAQAKEIILTGKRITGTTAMSIGLVNYCLPSGEVHKKALEIAREINEKGPLAIRMAKKAIDEGLEVNMSSSETIVKDCYAQLLYTKDRLEGLAAFAEKRKPKYKGE
ncbi:probable enoyl-CoA hydratase 2, mitochondrial [Humulus lupulus]|uniref:probable enoyl-CoA hydratase 2, mitochondrial n=1 Tax=Humulus lupulus TaxID=3486 RepID=UPI002B400CB8|nr:probable enoyl-CoA hydratase 2, mitochondrial [Humulus lupulus]